MDQWWQTFFSDPLHYIGYPFAFLAAFALLIYIRGLLSGMGYLFTIDWHDEHMHHYRVRAIWGVFALISIFVVWEIVRWFITGLISFFN